MFGNGDWVVYKSGRTSILGWINEAKVIASDSSNVPIKTMYQFYTTQRFLKRQTTTFSKRRRLASKPV